MDGDLTTADCRVPQVAKLAIGHIFVGTDEIFRNQEGSDLHWELYLDDKVIDLKEFGTYSYVLPTMAPNPSLIPEVLMKFTAWDIVLANLQPGAHTLDGRVRAGEEEYRWEVSLVIEAPSAEISSNDNRSRNSQTRCPRTMPGLSPFHNSCRMYGLDPKTGY